MLSTLISQYRQRKKARAINKSTSKLLRSSTADSNASFASAITLASDSSVQSSASIDSNNTVNSSNSHNSQKSIDSCSTDSTLCSTYRFLKAEVLPSYSDPLPTYSPSLTKKGCLSVKNEMSTPLKPSRYRKWTDVEVEVNNTQIRLTRHYGAGGVVRKTSSFSLQFAEVGLALDYTRKTNVFRLRVESKQFVFQCPNRQVMLNWMTALEIAIGLALPLELRPLPEEVKKRRIRHRDYGSSRSTYNPASYNSWDSTFTSWLDNNNTITLMTQRLGRELTKWRPVQRQSRFSFRDFPQLRQDANWEGKEFLYNGRWALIRNQQIEFVK